MQKEKYKASFCIDIGTSSLKAALINECGFVFNSTVIRFSDLIYNPFKITECWIESFFQASQNLEIDKYQIQSFCISGNGPTLIAINENKTFTLLWNKKIPENCPNFQLINDTKSIFIPRLLFFKNSYPEIFKESKIILSGPEFLIYFLTSQTLTILPEERFLQAYWSSEELTAKEIPENLLAKFVPLGYKAGNIKSQILSKLNISTKEKIPVFCGGPDFITALIGTNTLTAGKICDRSGSSEGINLCSEKPIYKDNFRNLPSVIPNLYNISYLLADTGTKFTQWKNTSPWKNKSYEECIKHLLENPKSQGYKIISEIAKDVNIAFTKIINEQSTLLTQENLKTTNIFCTGGQAKNPYWMQFKSDITKQVLCVTNCPDSELMGNAIIANVGLNNYSSILLAADKMVSVKTKFIPKNQYL